MAEKGKTVSYNFAGPNSYGESNIFRLALLRADITSAEWTSWSSDRHSVILPKSLEEKADSVFTQLFPDSSL